MTQLLLKEEILSFINALQLCLKTEILDWSQKENTLILSFEKKRKDDENLIKFQKLVSGSWEDTRYQITSSHQQITTLLTQFLLLTRLNDNNMIKLVEIDRKYEEFTRRILKDPSDKIPDYDIHNLASAAASVFGEIAKQKLTLRELSNRTGITSVAISNFKSGKDTRLSTFIKIGQALGLKIKITK